MTYFYYGCPPANSSLCIILKSSALWLSALVFSSNYIFVMTFPVLTLLSFSISNCVMVVNKPMLNSKLFFPYIIIYFLFSVSDRVVKYLIDHYVPFDASAAFRVHSIARCLTVSTPSSSPSRFSSSNHFLKKALWHAWVSWTFFSEGRLTLLCDLSFSTRKCVERDSYMRNSAL
jgi:hypothetical protein